MALNDGRGALIARHGGDLNRFMIKDTRGLPEPQVRAVHLVLFGILHRLDVHVSTPDKIRMVKKCALQPQSCVICLQPLPRNSKLTTASVSPKETVQNGWTGEKNPDGTVMVNMCLQRQIDQSKSRPQRELNAALIRNYRSREEG